MIYKIGDRVIITLGHKNETVLSGEVVSYPFYTQDDDLATCYVVFLDDGFWNPDKTVFVSHLVCVESVLKLEAS
jgi:hypothetical protein